MSDQVRESIDSLWAIVVGPIWTLVGLLLFASSFLIALSGPSSDEFGAALLLAGIGGLMLLVQMKVDLQEKVNE